MAVLARAYDRVVLNRSMLQPYPFGCPPEMKPQGYFYVGSATGDEPSELDGTNSVAGCSCVLIYTWQPTGEFHALAVQRVAKLSRPVTTLLSSNRH